MILESIVLPLDDSQALVTAGIVLDTALVWGMDYQETTTVFTYAYSQETFPDFKTFCPAPALSELLDAIRVKVSGAVISIYHRRDFGADIDLDDDASAFHYGVGQYPSDLKAAAALLMEISK